MDNQTNTSGGANVGGDVNAGNDFVGRDKIINEYAKSQREEQWQIALNWGKNPDKPSMQGFDLAKRDLAELSFDGANLSRVVLTGADLTESSFIGANLARANLEGADLTGAKFNGANLTRAKLTGAKVDGADFSGADLSGTDTFFCSADNKTIWPEGYKQPTITLPNLHKENPFR